MWVHNLNPTLVNLGPLEIRWYGLVYILGFFASVWWLLYNQRKGAIDASKEEIWDFVFYLMLGVLIGSRLFMVFWDPQHFLYHPLNLLKIWEGGMSFHGGLVGIITAAWLYCRKKKWNFARMADLMAVPAILALALGRVANFVNGELWGREWNGSWCVNFKNTGGGDVCRHPNMLYSAGQRLLVFFWLLYLQFKDTFQPGFIFWNFVLWEGVGRFLMDFFREDMLYIGFSLGQWFSAVMILFSVYVLMQNYRPDLIKAFKKKQPK